MRRLGGIVASALWLVASPSWATLTPSELVLVRQYTTSAQLANVQRVRSLVARPDLTDAESAQAMTGALSVPVTDARVAFLRELVFGAGSQASRNVLARAVVRGLVARADAILERAPDLDAPQSADAAELLRIYGFLDHDLADAGGAPFAGTSARPVHDATAGIDNATYDSCAKALADHLKRHAPRLQPGTPLGATATRVRAQAMLATFDMGGDSPTRTIDGSDRLGLDGVRRATLIERGVLLLDSGRSDRALAAAADVLRRVRPLAVDHVEAITFGDEHPGLRSRGLVLSTAAAIDSADRTRAFPADEVEPSPVAAPLAELAGRLALEVSKRTLDTHGDLRVVVERDAPSGTTPESAVAEMLGMLLVDAPRAVDLAMVRFLAGKPASVALLADAVGVLAASAGPSGVQSLVVGKASQDGTSAPLPLSDVRLLPSGAASSFAVGSSRWEITRGDTGIVTGVRHDGQPLAFAMLGTARVPVVGGQSWSGGGLALSALFGSPLVGVVSGPHARVVGQSDEDVVALPGSGGASDVAVDADVRANGTFAVLLRARAGRGDRGIGLRVVPGTPARVALVTLDERLAEHTLAEGTAPAGVEHVRVAIRAGKVRAVCTHRGARPVELEAAVPQQLTQGDVAFAVRKGVSLEIAAPVVRRN